MALVPHQDVAFLNSNYDKARDSAVLSLDITPTSPCHFKEGMTGHCFFSFYDTKRGVRIELI